MTRPVVGVRRVAALAVLLCALGSAGGCARAAADARPAIVRLANNPIIRPDMLPGRDGENINGPSLIRVPAWVPNPLGRYYLYFSHHSGTYIRLAYADRVAGPWTIHEPGTLHLRDVPAMRGHIASPDAIVDHERQQIRLYVHGPATTVPGQKTFVAVSTNGLDFTASDEILGLFYMRVFRWRDTWFGMAKGGLLHRSADGLSGFESGPNPFPGSELRDAEYNNDGPRHVAVHLVGDRLFVYYTSIGDAPERIFRTHIDLSPDWTTWRTATATEVLRPERDYEGVSEPIRKSRSGAVKGAEHALRDPGIFTDEDGRVYLIYSVAGESGLAIAEITTP